MEWVHCYAEILKVDSIDIASLEINWQSGSIKIKKKFQQTERICIQA